jgi:hypothetical protein
MPVVIVEAAMRRFSISTNGDGVLRERLFPADAIIDASSPIAVIVADGESVPYNRPYAIAESIPLF